MSETSDLGSLSAILLATCWRVRKSPKHRLLDPTGTADTRPPSCHLICTLSTRKHLTRAKRGLLGLPLKPRVTTGNTHGSFPPSSHVLGTAAQARGRQNRACTCDPHRLSEWLNAQHRVELQGLKPGQTLTGLSSVIRCSYIISAWFLCAFPPRLTIFITGSSFNDSKCNSRGEGAGFINNLYYHVLVGRALQAQRTRRHMFVTHPGPGSMVALTTPSQACTGSF